MSDATTLGGATGVGSAATATLSERVRTYARLAKLSVYFHWVPALVAAAMLTSIDARTAAVLVAFVVAVVCVAASGGALDDVSGIRDGIDQYTYKPGETLRKVTDKPIVLGQLSEAQALRFAAVTGALGLVLGSAAIALAPHQPAWVWPVWLVLALAGIQYSYGLRLSYHAVGELVLGAAAAAVVCVPYGFATGTLNDTIAFEAFLTGAWFVQTTLFSSSQDREVDRRAGRLTMAARLSVRANRVFICSVFLAIWAATAVGFATGTLPVLLAIALVPCWALEAGQLFHGVGHSRWLMARAMGWHAFRLGLLALIVVNLIEFH